MRAGRITITKMGISFSTTALSVLLLVAMAIPGFIVIKTKVVKPAAISAFAAVLLYVSQPFLSLRSFLQVEYSNNLALNLLIVFAASLVFQGFVFLVLWLIFKKRFDDPITTARIKAAGFLNSNSGVIISYKDLPEDVQQTARGRAYRVMVLTSTFGNVGFFGVPILQVIFSDITISATAIAYSAVYIVSMNLMFWTIGAYTLTGDKKYISIKKALLNPQIITMIVALPLFFGKVTMGLIESSPVPQFAKIINYLADMTAPMCMLILGMRFALAPLKELFTDWKTYVSSFIKLIIFPIVVWAILLPSPFEDSLMKSVLIILSAMPSASFNLNLAELFDADQKSAANAILLSTLFSIITIPAIVALSNVTL